jgi:hypothetical protein
MCAPEPAMLSQRRAACAAMTGTGIGDQRTRSDHEVELALFMVRGPDGPLVTRTCGTGG